MDTDFVPTGHCQEWWILCGSTEPREHPVVTPGLLRSSGCARTSSKRSSEDRCRRSLSRPRFVMYDGVRVHVSGVTKSAHIPRCWTVPPQPMESTASIDHHPALSIHVEA